MTVVTPPSLHRWESRSGRVPSESLGSPDDLPEPAWRTWPRQVDVLDHRRLVLANVLFARWFQLPGEKCVCRRVRGAESSFHRATSPAERQSVRVAGLFERPSSEGKETLHWTRLSCHRFWANEVRLLLGVIAYNLGNLLRRLVLPLTIQSWSLTSLQQRLFKTGGRLIRHARYFLLQLAESHLTSPF